MGLCQQVCVRVVCMHFRCEHEHWPCKHTQTQTFDISGEAHELPPFTASVCDVCVVHRENTVNNNHMFPPFIVSINVVAILQQSRYATIQPRSVIQLVWLRWRCRLWCTSTGPSRAATTNAAPTTNMHVHTGVQALIMLHAFASYALITPNSGSIL